MLSSHRLAGIKQPSRWRGNVVASEEALDHNIFVGYIRLVTDLVAILNEREARDAKATLAEIDRALTSEQVFEQIVAGLPPEVVNGYRRALRLEGADLQEKFDAYEAAKSGDYSQLKRIAGADPGVALIVARITRGYSQKELARRLGLKEQQIQRYEADRYRSISLSNYRRVAHVLGVRWDIELSDAAAPWHASGWEFATDISSNDIKKVLKHAAEHRWFAGGADGFSEKGNPNYLSKYIADHIMNYGSPTLLRSGLNMSGQVNDLFLIAWKSRVTRVAEGIIDKDNIKYLSLDISWLRELVRLSPKVDGPARARDSLRTQGIVLVCEPQISGLNLDGAAFLVGRTPVIGLTLRRDTIDSFWFTLLHEIAHVILHYRTGLRSGFFDDIDSPNVDEIEKEADGFASNMLIPDEQWQRSTARIAKDSATIVRLAEELGIHPAIIFGRVQKERGNYATFAEKIGRGGVRKWLLEHQ